MRFVSAKQVHRTRHEAVAETSATSPIDENSKVLGQNQPVTMACIASSNSLNVYGSVSVSSALGRSGNTTHITGMRHLCVRMPRERPIARRPMFPALLECACTLKRERAASQLREG